MSAREKALARVRDQVQVTAHKDVAQHPANPGHPAEPWVCSGDYCAGCSFDRMDGEHPKSCRHHDPVDAAGWEFWKDDPLPAHAVAAIAVAKHQGVTLPQALLTRVM
jgi:hypothetical protein